MGPKIDQFGARTAPGRTEIAPHEPRDEYQRGQQEWLGIRSSRAGPLRTGAAGEARQRPFVARSCQATRTLPNFASCSSPFSVRSDAAPAPEPVSSRSPPSPARLRLQHAEASESASLKGGYQNGFGERIECGHKARTGPIGRRRGPVSVAGISRDSSPELGSAECAKRLNLTPEGVRRGEVIGGKLRPQTPTSNRFNFVLNLVQFLAPLGSRIP